MSKDKETADFKISKKNDCMETNHGDPFSRGGVYQSEA